MVKHFLTGTLMLGVVFLVRADTGRPDFSGHWQLGAADSQATTGQSLSLDIQANSDQIVLTRVYRESDGKQATSHFTCTVGAKECVFDENGYKAKVSLWYNGPELVILKTDGPKRDATVEWHLRLGTDGKTLTVQRELVDPSDKTEKLVYTKTESIATR